MTVDDRRTIDLSDLLALQVECQCGTTVVGPLPAFDAKPFTCAGCGQSIWTFGTMEAKVVSRFLDAFRALHAQAADQSAPVKVRLQVTRPG
jgi:hypothetical protein